MGKDTTMDEQTLTKLEPCPFCGTEDKLKEFAVPNTNGNRRFIRCIGCGTEGPWSYKPLSASDQWNRRALTPARDGGLEELTREQRDMLTAIRWRAAKFVHKVRSGLAQSKETFADMNWIIEQIDAALSRPLAQRKEGEHE